MKLRVPWLVRGSTEGVTLQSWLIPPMCSLVVFLLAVCVCFVLLAWLGHKAKQLVLVLHSAEEET